MQINLTAVQGFETGIAALKQQNEFFPGSDEICLPGSGIYYLRCYEYPCKGKTGSQ